MLKEAGEEEDVFFWELHNDNIGDWLRLQMLKGLQEERPNLVVSSEIFESEEKLNLDEWVTDQITESNFDSEANLWKNYSTDYRPVLRYAKEKGLKFIATNVPRKYASLVSKAGLSALDSLSPQAKKYFATLPMQVDMNMPGYVAMKDMMHGAPGNSDFMIQAQALKDATMAESLYTLKEIRDDKVVIKREVLKESLLTILEREIPHLEILHTADGNPDYAMREQWFDGANVFAIGPRRVISYNRNIHTNRALRQMGVEVLEIPSSELSRGLGGPRCMTMPLSRSRV